MDKKRKLTSLRALKGWTQEEMAKRLDMNFYTYQNKENGKNEFTESEINKILLYFNKRYEEIFLNPDSRKEDKEVV